MYNRERFLERIKFYNKFVSFSICDTTMSEIFSKCQLQMTFIRHTLISLEALKSKTEVAKLYLYSALISVNYLTLLYVKSIKYESKDT